MAKDDTRYFYDLTPERVLAAVETTGVRCTGRVSALNSLENRVYEVEIELEQCEQHSRYDSFRVAKFYRPGRWTLAQIEEEHAFIRQLADQEIPVVVPLELSDTSSIGRLKEADIFFCIWPRVGGRILDEPNKEQLLQLGRLTARLHNIGATQPAQHRLHLNPATYGAANLERLLEEEVLPDDYVKRYTEVVVETCRIAEGLFSSAAVQRIHGDLHYGNILWQEERPLLVDFDDMVMGPCVQDLWLIILGRDDEAKKRRDLLLQGYEEFRVFDDAELYLIEPLRALRIMQFNTWIACRRKDPAFQRVFSSFGTREYWRDQLMALEEALCLIQGREW